MQASVTEWLVNSAKNNPDAVAIVDENGVITYKEYYDKSVGLAKLILDKQVGNRKPIIVYMEKCKEVIVSFMGIAFSGNFYSPIDVTMPESRVNKILETLQPSLVITTAELKTRFQKFSYGGDFLIYEDVESIGSSAEVEKALSKIIDTDLLYVLFTSGSTGMPKGVSITHRGVIDYIDVITDLFSFEPSDCLGNQAPFYFDNSILDIYVSMKTGGTLNIIPTELFAQPVRLLAYLKDNNINSIFWVPSALILVAKIKAFKSVNLENCLKRVLFCGEVMPNKQLNVWRNYLPNVLYANLYGPTEITDACTYYIVNREFNDDDPLPIGNAMRNTEIMVLDDKDCLIEEPGSVGELCVRGTGVATGYYNNPGKTKEAFVQNPLNNAYEEKIYRTGDLVKYNEFGELLYLSRKDFQIKHKGHRIELGEIETAISALDEVTMCCCLYDEKRSRIIAFIDADISNYDLNLKLEKYVPDYMLPGKVVYIDKFQLNANGKIDRVWLKQKI